MDGYGQRKEHRVERRNRHRQQVGR
jgi:hypothetical protein